MATDVPPEPPAEIATAPHRTGPGPAAAGLAAAVRAERRSFADTLERVDPAAPTGCGSWTVALSLRDVDTGVEWRAGAGGEGPEIVVSGAAGELVLWLAGREATVEIAGDQRTASRLGAGLHI